MHPLVALLPVVALFAITSEAIINGGPGNDTLSGTKNNDLIYGRGGADTITGRKGRDELYGGTGDDIVKGSVGFDYLHGGDGADLLRGGPDRDNIEGEEGSDIIFGDDGDDKLFGDSGNSKYGFVPDYAKGNDILHGGPLFDSLYGGGGNDKLYVDMGVDENAYKPSAGHESVHPGSGADLVVLGTAGAADDNIFYYGDEILADVAAGAAADVIQNFDKMNDVIKIDLYGTEIMTSMIGGRGEYLTIKIDGKKSNFAQVVGQNATDLIAFGCVEIVGG